MERLEIVITWQSWWYEPTCFRRWNQQKLEKTCCLETGPRWLWDPTDSVGSLIVSSDWRCDLGRSIIEHHEDNSQYCHASIVTTEESRIGFGKQRWTWPKKFEFLEVAGREHFAKCTSIKIRRLKVKRRGCWATWTVRLTKTWEYMGCIGAKMLLNTVGWLSCYLQHASRLSQICQDRNWINFNRLPG